MIRNRKHIAALSLAKFSFIFLIFAGIVSAILIFIVSRPVSSSESEADFKVSKGESVKSVAANLEAAKLIRSELYFRFVVRKDRLTIQAGDYTLSPSQSPSEIAQALTRGFAEDKKITIPEGFRSEQIAETAGIPVKTFLNAAKGLEGQLFPDTYFVKKDISASELVTIMHENYTKKVGSIDRETLILASLVERETKGDDEKPIVAGILKKRLSAGWALELDATVQYVLGKPGNWWPNTTLLDRKIKSPYNTYLNTGLPPSPIGNPGLASIRAVQNAALSTYWFYLHDREGNIRYATTLEEHNLNIAKYIN